MYLDSERLLLLLEEKNMTQKELASRIHIAPNTLNGYIRIPNRRIEPAVLESIARELDVSVSYLTSHAAPRETYGAPENENERSLLNTYRRLNENNQKKMEAIFNSLLDHQ